MKSLWLRVSLAAFGVLGAVVAGVLTAVLTAERVQIDFPIYESNQVAVVAPQEYAANTQ